MRAQVPQAHHHLTRRLAPHSCTQLHLVDFGIQHRDHLERDLARTDDQQQRRRLAVSRAFSRIFSRAISLLPRASAHVLHLRVQRARVVAPRVAVAALRLKHEGRVRHATGERAQPVPISISTVRSISIRIVRRISIRIAADARGRSAPRLVTSGVLRCSRIGVRTICSESLVLHHIVRMRIKRPLLLLSPPRLLAISTT
eukprot:3523539-Pleurochrysis_carterae.AAC.1